MPRVGCPSSPYSSHEIQSFFVQYATEHVPSDTIFLAETFLLDTPEFVSSYERILFPDFQNKVNDKHLYCEFSKQDVVITFIKGLSADTSQCTESVHWILLPFSMQPFDCPVSAFFRISISNISSATSIIVS